MAYYGFALTATHFFSNAKKSKQKTLAPACGPLAGARGSFAPGSIRAQRLRFASLHLLLAVFGCAKRSLRSHARINPSTQPSDVARGSRSKAGELTLGLLSGEERGVVGLGFVLELPLTPALSRGRGGRFVCFSRPQLNAVSHVGVTLPNTTVSPLSLWERARVRGF